MRERRSTSLGIGFVAGMMLAAGYVTPARAGEQIRVAVYRQDERGLKTYGDEGIHAALAEAVDIAPGHITNMSAEVLAAYDVLIIPQGHQKSFKYSPNGWKDIVREWVAEGHGVMPLHDVIGCRYHKWDLFPEIAKGKGARQEEELVIATGHPVTLGAAPNQNIELQVFRHAYYDHVYLEAGSEGLVLVSDIVPDEEKKQLEVGDPVVVVGTHGKGRVMVNGMIPGWHKDDYEKAPVGGERRILLDGVRWLARRTPVTREGVYRLVKGTDMGPLYGEWVESPDGLIREKRLSPREVEEKRLAFIGPILQKVSPPPLKGRSIKDIPIGVLQGGKSDRWLEKLEGWGCQAKLVKAADIARGLPGVSVLVIADAQVERRYLPVLEKFIEKGGKLLVTERGGYNREKGKYNLVNLIHAGRYMSTISIQYMEHGMPEEIKKKDIDKRRQEYVLDKARTPIMNGAEGLSYFTLAKLRKAERWRNWFPACKEPILNGMGSSDYTKELNLITRMSPIWSRDKGPVLKAVPWMIQMAYFDGWPNRAMIDVKAQTEYCRENGINVMCVQIFRTEEYLKGESNGVIMKKKVLKRLIPDLDKAGIQLWVNIYPPKPYYNPRSKTYVEEHPEEVTIYDDGKPHAWICPIRSDKALKGQLRFLEKLFTEFPYFNGVSLDEPRRGARACFCPECKKLFEEMHPGEKMAMDNPVFQEFREYVVAEYMVKPYAEFLRKVRPRTGVLFLATPSPNMRSWGIEASKIANAGTQVFGNEYAYKRNDTKTDDLLVRHIPQPFSFSRIALTDHPILEGIKAETSSQSIKIDVFRGGEAIGYVTDGTYTYPGIVVGDDDATAYFAFDPLAGGQKLVSNTLSWFVANARDNVPDGMVLIPGGKFRISVFSKTCVYRLPDDMEDEEAETVAFYLDKYEVTNKEYERFDPDHKRSALSSADHMPVSNVTWKDAVLYCNWRSGQEGLAPVYDEKRWWETDFGKNGYRLPTQAEWQKAAKGPENHKYAWGDHWWRAEGRAGVEFDEGALDVGTYAPNTHGLHDMTGNVWEWCDERVASSGKLISGGCWHSGETESRISFYNFLHTTHKFQCRRATVGFRCARNIGAVSGK